MLKVLTSVNWLAYERISHPMSEGASKKLCKSKGQMAVELCPKHSVNVVPPGLSGKSWLDLTLDGCASDQRGLE